MKSWEIVESINTIGYVKTFELITQQRREHKPRESGEMSWEEIVERNRRAPPQVERDPGEEG